MTHETLQQRASREIERRSRHSDLLVIAPLKEWTCTSCGGIGDLLLMEDAGRASTEKRRCSGYANVLTTC